MLPFDSSGRYTTMPPVKQLGESTTGAPSCVIYGSADTTLRPSSDTEAKAKVHAVKERLSDLPHEKGQM